MSKNTILVLLIICVNLVADSSLNDKKRLAAKQCLNEYAKTLSIDASYITLEDLSNETKMKILTWCEGKKMSSVDKLIYEKDKKVNVIETCVHEKNKLHNK